MLQTQVLDNGVTIITEEIPYVRSVSIGFWVGAGSRHEDPTLGGVSHFIEHMLFKGTERRSAKEIANTIDAIGGQLNAFTGKEYTCFYARVLDEHLPIAVDVLSDMFFHSRFSPEDFIREKQVIEEEIKMYEDSPDELVHDLFAQAIWNDHPLGRAILGTQKTVNYLSRDDVLDFFYRMYTPDNLVIAIAGNVRHQTAVEILRPVFDGWAGSSGLRNRQTPHVTSRRVVKTKDTEQVHLCIGTKGLEQNDESIFTLHLLNTILGGGVSSRLFQKIREDRGLAYSVYSYQTSYKDAGLFTVYAGMRPANLKEVAGIILEEFFTLAQKPVDPEELFRAKALLKGNLMLSLESTNNRMSRLGKGILLLGKILTPDEILQRISQVTGEDILELAKQIFDPALITMAAIGPVGEEVFTL